MSIAEFRKREYDVAHLQHLLARMTSIGAET